MATNNVFFSQAGYEAGKRVTSGGELIDQACEAVDPSEASMSN